MSLAGCQINLIDVNFHLKKSLEDFDKNSAVKIWSKNDKEIKVSPLMPIRFNGQWAEKGCWLVKWRKDYFLGHTLFLYTTLR